MIKGSWIFKVEIVNYYKYSLYPKKSEYMLIFGDKWEEYYNEALLNQKQPSLAGYIRYYKEFIKRNIFEYLIKREKRVRIF